MANVTFAAPADDGEPSRPRSSASSNWHGSYPAPPPTAARPAARHRALRAANPIPSIRARARSSRPRSRRWAPPSATRPRTRSRRRRAISRAQSIADRTSSRGPAARAWNEGSGPQDVMPSTGHSELRVRPAVEKTCTASGTAARRRALRRSRNSRAGGAAAARSARCCRAALPCGVGAPSICRPCRRWRREVRRLVLVELVVHDAHDLGLELSERRRARATHAPPSADAAARRHLGLHERGRPQRERAPAVDDERERPCRRSSCAGR